MSSYNIQYLRDLLYENVIQDCLSGKIVSVTKRNFKNIEELYNYTYKDVLASYLYSISASRCFNKFKSNEYIEKELFKKKLDETIISFKKHKQKVMPEILVTAWLTTDSFKWSNVNLLPNQISSLKNTFNYDLVYGLVNNFYEPVCFYALSKLNMFSTSESLKCFLLSLDSSIWTTINTRTKNKINNNFKFQENRQSTVNELYEMYSKCDYLNLL